MKNKLSIYALITALITSPAYAEGWNTGTDLIKAGTKMMVLGPVVFPVKAVQNVAQGKLTEAAEDLLFVPVAPIAGLVLTGFGVLFNTGVNSTNNQVVFKQPIHSAQKTSTDTRIQPSTYPKPVAGTAQNVEPIITIDESSLAN